jgi:hypothetical protein
VRLPQAGHFLVSEPHLLQAVGHQLAGAPEAGEILDRFLDAGAQLLDPAHPRGHLAHRPVEPLDVAGEGAHPERLLGDPLDVGVQAGGLLAQRPHLRLDRRGTLAGGVEDREARLAFLDRVPEVGDPLAHRVQTAVLQLEALAALPHLFPQIVQRLAGRLLGFLGLLRHRLQLLGTGQHLRLGRLHLGDLGLDLAEAPDLLFLAPEPGVELAVEPGKLRDLGGRPVHRLALLLQHPGLLRHLVRQRLEHREPVLKVGHCGHRLVHWLEGAGKRLHPALNVLQPAGGGLAVLVECLQPRGAVPVSRERVVRLGPHPRDAVGKLGQLGPELVGIAMQRLYRALLAEEVIELLAKLQHPVHFVVHRLHASLQLVHLRLRLDHPLRLGDRRGELCTEFLDPGHLRLDRYAPLAQRLQLRRAIQDRSEGPDLFCGGLGSGHESLERGGDVRPAGIDGDYAVVRAAAAFQEGDHGLTPRDSARGGDEKDARRTCPRCATDMPNAGRPSRPD